MSTAAIWILSLTSFYSIDEPNDSDYWTTIFDGISTDIEYTTSVSELSYINNDDITAANMIKVTMEIDLLYYTDNNNNTNGDTNSDNVISSYEQFLELTNDLDPTTIATLIQSDVSSKLDYYIIASVYEDPDDAEDLIENLNANLVAYTGENGEEQTQDYPTDGTLTCISPVYIECGIASNADTLTAIQYVNIWDALLPNTTVLTSTQSTFPQAADSYTYHITKRVLGDYDTLGEYEWDYDFNGDFNLDDIELNLYELNEGLEGKENTVDINCFLALTACGDTDICDIKLPWCDGTETEFDRDNGPIEGTSTANMKYISLMSVFIVIFVNFVAY